MPLVKTPEHERLRDLKLPSKITYLDGLRGVAAFVVVLAHFCGLVLPPGWLRESSLLASRVAVLVFFVHSGFVLSWKYLKVSDRGILISMALRRAFRLGIPIAVIILFAFGLMRLGVMRNAELARQIGSADVFVTMYQFYPSLGSAVADSLGGWFFYPSVRYDISLWTMPIELVCSYIVFLILPFVIRIPTGLLALLLLTASIFALPVYPWLVCFLVGMLFVRLYQEGRFNPDGLLRRNLGRWPWLIGLGWATAMAPVLWPANIGGHSRLTAPLGLPNLMQIISASTIVLLLFGLPRFQRVLDWHPVQLMGRLSFSVYLIHIPLMCSLSSWLILLLRQTRIPYLLSCLLVLILTVIAIYALSYLMAKYVDQWAINFGKEAIARRLYGNRDARQTVESPL